MMKILIIQLRQLGDVLLSSLLARVIKERLNDSAVHFLTSHSGFEIISGNPFIDKILVFDGFLKTIDMMRREGYDAVIDVQRTGRSRILTLLSISPKRIAFEKERWNPFYNVPIRWKNHGYTAWERMELLKGLGIETPVERYMPRIYYGSKYIEKVNLFLKSKGLSDYFVLVPTARKPEKIWGLENYAVLMDFLVERFNITPVVCYGPNERGIAEAVVEKTKHKSILIDSPFSIKEFAVLVGKSKFFIGNNSFASHVAISQRVKTFVITKRQSGWFPPVDWVFEIHGNESFPSVSQVLSVFKQEAKKSAM